MEPDGDPEARIRELERTLADQARSSELGTRPYGSTGSAQPSANVPVPHYPYLPQPDPHQQAQHDYGSAQYNSPYYSPPQRVVHKRSPALVLLPIIFGVVSVGIVGTIVFANLADPGSPAGPASDDPGYSGGGTVDAPENDTERPGNPKNPVPVEPVEEIATVGAGDTLSLGGVDQRKTVMCSQGTVNISGMTNTIEIRGDCASVSVSGIDNVITVETAGSITASGFDNRITYRTGDPGISKSGSGNVIERG